ncbi:unnamed protein product [Clavelina lepadiformis]|uniref:Uncharacterized protein n=1 Tax=Clavelina lepadiformis TaxID=159417 RepID=A0ABP0FIV7_CLALP
MPTLNFKSDFTPNPNPSIKWSHFARCDPTLGSNPTTLETGIIFILDRKEQLHDEQLFHTLLPTMQNLNFNARFHPKPNPSMKWSNFARCRWSISPNPENLETGIVFSLFGRKQFHHTELVQTPFPTMLTLNFRSDFTSNPNPSIKWSHFARCRWSISLNPEDLETDRKEQLHDEQLFHTLLPTMQNLNFNARFHPNPNPSMKWSHFARCRWSISSNPEDLETGIVFNLFGRKQFHHTDLVQTPFPTMLTLNFKSDFTPNPNPSIKWSHFASCDRTLGSNPTNIEKGIVFILDRKEQLHDEQLFHTLLPTMQNLNFNARFHPNPNPSMKWSHFARCRWSISSNPEDLETGIVFNLFGREQFHHTELVQTPFPTMPTTNFQSDFTPNPNPSIKWSHFARCDRTLGSNPTNLETGIIFILDRKEQLHDEQLFHMPLPTMQNLNFNARFHPKPNPSMKWSHFARCRWSISPNPEDLETGIVFNLFGREQFHHTELVQTPFPTMLTLNFKSDFTPNLNLSIKWSHFARCDRSLSPNPENLENGIVFNLFGRKQFHHTELVQTPFPTILTLNVKGAYTSNPSPSINRNHFARCDRSLGSNPTNLETDRKEQLHDEQLFHTLLPTMQNLNFNARFHPNPNPSMKWSHFARCRWSISSNPEDLETDSKEQLHDEQLFHMPLPTMQNLNFNARFHPKPNPSMKWSHFARCRWSISPNPEDLETGIVFNLFGREQFHHTELVQTPFPTMLTLNFKSDFTPNLNLSIKWSHFARCDRSLSPNPENLENGIVFNLFGRKQFHHTELVQTPFPTILTLNVKGAYTSNPSPSINRNHFARCDRSLGSNPTNLETGIVFILDRKEQLHDEQLFHTLLPTMQNLNFNARFHPNPNPSMKWSHFARCRW